MLNRRWLVRVLVGCLAPLMATAAGAQFTQYSLPGSFDITRPTIVPNLERAVQDARWKLGPLYADPWIALREITYDDNIGSRPDDEDQVSDVSVTVGAGLRGYVPAGDFILAAHLLPEYVWWQDLSDRNRFNGRYGLGLFGQTGRLGVELAATRTDDARFFSRELEDRIDTRDERANLTLELTLGGGLSLAAEASVRSFEFQQDEAGVVVGDPTVLNRDEDVLRGAFRYRFPRGLMVGLGVEDSEAEFDRISGRSNSGTAPVLELFYDSPRWQIDVDLADRDLEFDPGLEHLAFQEVTGRVKLVLRPANRLELQLYGRNNLVYSFSNNWAYFEDTVAGAGIRTSLSSWASFRVFAEDGNDEFAPFVAGTNQREDDFESLGGELELRVRAVTLLLYAVETDFDSNLPAFERNVTLFRLGLTLGRRSVSPWY